jgi:putative endonuclease
LLLRSKGWGLKRRKTQVRKTTARRKRVGTGKRKPVACYCYIVECCDGTYYTGWTVDIERRLKVHNAGRGARYTSSRRPVRLVYLEPQPDQSTAMKRERAIKRLKRPQKQALIRRVQT